MRNRLNNVSYSTVIAIMFGLAMLPVAFGNNLRLAEADNGATNSVKSGTVIEIILEGNPTTGYEWGVASFSTNSLRQIGEARYQPAEPADKRLRVGVGGRFIFKFKAAESGRGDLKLVYRRSWETTACDKVYSVVIDVR
jgi:inhibitor of cysteine peptidase